MGKEQQQPEKDLGTYYQRGADAGIFAIDPFSNLSIEAQQTFLTAVANPALVDLPYTVAGIMTQLADYLNGYKEGLGDFLLVLTGKEAHPAFLSTIVKTLTSKEGLEGYKRGLNGKSPGIPRPTEEKLLQFYRKNGVFGFELPPKKEKRLKGYKMGFCVSYAKDNGKMPYTTPEDNESYQAYREGVAAIPRRPLFNNCLTFEFTEDLMRYNDQSFPQGGTLAEVKRAMAVNDELCYKSGLEEGMRRLGISVPACYIRSPHALIAFKKAISGEPMPEFPSSEQMTFAERRNQEQAREAYNLGMRVSKIK